VLGLLERGGVDVVEDGLEDVVELGGGGRVGVVVGVVGVGVADGVRGSAASRGAGSNADIGPVLHQVGGLVPLVVSEMGRRLHGAAERCHTVAKRCDAVAKRCHAVTQGYVSLVDRF